MLRERRAFRNVKSRKVFGQDNDDEGDDKQQHNKHQHRDDKDTPRHSEKVGFF